MERGKGIHIIVVIIAIVSVLGGVIYLTTRPKAQFEISDLGVSRPSENPGKDTKIFFTLSNTGDRPGTFDAELQMDGDIFKNISVKLTGNEKKKINLSAKVDEPGEHSVRIGDLSENFKIGPPEFKVSDLNTSSKVVESGESLTVNVQVKNLGDLSGEYTAKLKVDGLVEKRETVTILGGENKTISFELIKETKDNHTVSIGGLSESFEVLVPPELEVSDLSVSHSLVNPGESVTVTANIKNVGDLSGNRIFKLRINGNVEDNESVRLEGHQSTSLEFVISKQREGTYSVRVGGAVSSFQVYVPSVCPVCSG